MQAARPLAPCLHHSVGPRHGGGFFMAAVLPVRSFYPWSNFEVTIRENTHDNQQEQTYYRQLFGRRLASLN
jgi:hypothetical protein